jgi:hypothetical protein
MSDSWWSSVISNLVAVAVVHESLSAVVGKLIVPAAKRRDVAAIIEASTDSINRDWMTINFPSDSNDVQRAMFSKRCEDLVLSLIFTHVRTSF